MEGIRPLPTINSTAIYLKNKTLKRCGNMNPMMTYITTFILKEA